CFQGELAYVERLLAKGISTVAPTPKVDVFLKSALHVAAVAGQKAVARRLLYYSACVYYKAVLGVRNQTRIRTAIEAALENDGSIFESSVFPSRAAFLEICAYLVGSGATEAEAELLLREACKCGNLEITKRMLQRGTRIQTLPVSKNVELYQIFLDAG